jgi:3-phenylpropionate/trans-cinnamate dioxygenase ferredoxin reductase component
MTSGSARSGRAVIVGASLAGLPAAEALRAEGFAGSLTLIGDESYKPYDKPPLCKRVLAGGMPAELNGRRGVSTWLIADDGNERR